MIVRLSINQSDYTYRIKVLGHILTLRLLSFDDATRPVRWRDPLSYRTRSAPAETESILRSNSFIVQYRIHCLKVVHKNQQIRGFSNLVESYLPTSNIIHA